MWGDLVCPVDRGALDIGRDWMACTQCGRGFPVLDGIPTFLPVDDDPRWRAARRGQLARLPRANPRESNSRSVLMRRRARRLESSLAPFVQLGPRSRLLQVGVPGEGELHHFRTGIRYAIDPLAGPLHARGLLRWGQVRWISARGEELPFPGGSFRLIILSDVLDVVESPARLLSEANRVLADDGVLWLSVRATPELASDRPGDGAPKQDSKSRLWQFTLRELSQAVRRASFAPAWSSWEDFDEDDPRVIGGSTIDKSNGAGHVREQDRAAPSQSPETTAVARRLCILRPVGRRPATLSLGAAPFQPRIAA